MKVGILISYVAGTQRLMQACLSAIRRYDAGVDYSINVICESGHLSEAKEVCKDLVDSIRSYDVAQDAVGSERHATLLDGYMFSAEGLILTLDSDCLPVADEWLGELCWMLRPEFILPGIKWPWKPPSDDLDGIEGRVRGNQNWDNTWVACQLVDAQWIRDNKLKYSTGDDTGFSLTAKARELGYRMPGWLPTRCALPDGDIDPELNRMMCVVYGDKMVHIGGGSGNAVGRIVDKDAMYSGAIERILTENGAEWMMKDGNNHKYSFDKEPEVVEYKMRMMYNEMRRYLETHDSLFVS